MGNFLKETVSKVGLSVTQSVTSAVAVTLISTYLLVDFGKKDKGAAPPAVDSTRSTTIAAPGQNPRGEERAAVREDQRAGNSGREQSSTSRTGEPAGGEREMKGAPVQTASGGGFEGKRESPAPETAPPRNPTEAKLETAILDSRAKADSLVKKPPQDEKAKEAKKEVKDVHQRVDDVFDELDQEVEQKPQ